MDDALTIRLVKAKAQDAEKLAELSKRAFHTDMFCGSPSETPSGPPGYDSATAHVRFMKACDYYKILRGTVTVGAIMAKRRAPRRYECTGLFVDPDLHNQGIATRAFDLLWQESPLAKRWIVGTPAWNVRTRHFYEKLGFELVGSDGQDGVIYEKRMD
jgi:GNAT superfamily N-acetyltransferase